MYVSNRSRSSTSGAKITLQQIWFAGGFISHSASVGMMPIERNPSSLWLQVIWELNDVI